MLDREAIRDLACRYAHYVWQRDAAAVAELFTEDGLMETPDLPDHHRPQEIVESYEQIFSEHGPLPLRPQPRGRPRRRYGYRHLSTSTCAREPTNTTSWRPGTTRTATDASTVAG